MDIRVLDTQLRHYNETVNSQIITDQIVLNNVEHSKMKSNYYRYKADQVPIFERTFEDKKKVNNRINNAFDADIIDTKVGYFIGHGITYQIGEEQPNHKEANQFLTNFLIENSMRRLDTEIVKTSAIAGRAYRLLYIDADAKAKIKTLDPWEVIPIRDRNTGEIVEFLWVYEMDIIEGVDIKKVKYVHWYTEKEIHYYIENPTTGKFTLDYITQDQNPKPHGFESAPLVEFLNNEEGQADCDKVYKLIDAYDRVISDFDSELEQFRQAYMAFYGYELSQEVLEQAKKSGAFSMGSDGKVEFITKALDITAIDGHLNRLEDNILRFAKSVNFSDEAFGGNITGVAQKFKTMALENKCITLEAMMESALRRQFKLLCGYWKLAGDIDIDYTNIYFTFKRNIPINLLEEAEITGKLRGHVSENTRLAQLSIVDDVDWEKKRMEEDIENLPNVDLTDDDNDDE